MHKTKSDWIEITHDWMGLKETFVYDSREFAQPLRHRAPGWALEGTSAGDTGKERLFAADGISPLAYNLGPRELWSCRPTAHIPKAQVRLWHVTQQWKLGMDLV